MTDPDRTPEMDAADRAVETALDQCAAAYGWTGVRTGHLTGVASVMYDDTGTQCTNFAVHMPDRQGWITTLGLNTALRLRIEADYLTADD